MLLYHILFINELYIDKIEIYNAIIFLLYDLEFFYHFSIILNLIDSAQNKIAA